MEFAVLGAAGLILALLLIVGGVALSVLLDVRRELRRLRWDIVDRVWLDAQVRPLEYEISICDPLPTSEAVVDAIREHERRHGAAFATGGPMPAPRGLSVERDAKSC